LKKIILAITTLTILVSLFSLNGCVPSQTSEDIEILPADRLVKKLEANRRKIRAFEGTGTIDIKSSAFNNSATFRVVMVKPDSIYFTVLGPFGIELAQTLVTKTDFVFYETLSNTVYRGDMSDDILETIFKVNLSFNDLIDALVGAVNLTDNLYKAPSTYQVVYDKYLIGYIDSTKNITYNYRVDVRDLGITDYSVKNAQGKIVLEGEYSKFGVLDGVAIPYKISVANKNDNQLITISYKNIAVNARNIFIDFKLPADATVIQW
jgi:outer membrane lipoprotein-sorting protein